MFSGFINHGRALRPRFSVTPAFILITQMGVLDNSFQVQTGFIYTLLCGVFFFFLKRFRLRTNSVMFEDLLIQHLSGFASTFKVCGFCLGRPLSEAWPCSNVYSELAITL